MRTVTGATPTLTASPVRIRMSRAAGWRKPEGAVYVGRPTRWGNPFRIDSDWMVWAAVGAGFTGDKKGRSEAAVRFYRAWMTGGAILAGPRPPAGGALEFGDGSVVAMSDHVASTAIGIAALHKAPVLPERPDVEPLRGHDLACWCPLDAPCHADVLLVMANGSHG